MEFDVLESPKKMIAILVVIGFVAAMLFILPAPQAAGTTSANGTGLVGFAAASGPLTVIGVTAIVLVVVGLVLLYLINYL